jgi:hypothetical protein
MDEENPGLNAYCDGLKDARKYNSCEPKYNSEEEMREYRSGYGRGIEISIAAEGGICPYELRGDSQ